MSLAEVKEAIENLSAAEQLALTEYLQTKRLQNEEWRREMSRRLDEMDAGNKYTSEQVEALAAKLEAEGR